MRLTPLGQAPDELSHVGYVTGTAFDHRLPTATTPEKQQPPLYYLLVCCFRSSRWATTIRCAECRWCWSCATLVTVSKVASFFRVGGGWGGPRRLPAALPEFQYISGSVNNDALAWFAGAVIVLCRSG